MQIIKESISRPEVVGQNSVHTKTAEWRWYHLLPVVAAFLYMFTPILSFRFGIPGAVKFIGDLLVMAMIGLAIGRMLTRDRIPGAFLVIIALTIVGAIVATFEGQSSDVTVYGWWMMFRFPMVGLFVYLVPNWPRSMTAWIPKVMLYLLAIQVSVQITFYLLGSRDYDSLAGTFGYFGIGAFTSFIFLVLALALGKWLAKGEWKMLIFTIALGIIASAIGEIKLFLIAAPIMAIVALSILLLKGAQIRNAILLLAFFAIAISVFLIAYDAIVVQGLGKAPLESYLDSENRNRYFNFTRDTGFSYRLGRNSEVVYGWQLIQRDTTTLLFGHGLGTRQHSPELGLVGTGLQNGLYGYFIGRSFLALSYEMGLVGLIVILLFTALISIFLYRAANRDEDVDMNVIRYGVILYTLFWPVWIWYQSIWIMAAPSILYWMLWGYALHYSISQPRRYATLNSTSEEQGFIDSPDSAPA